LGAPNQFKELVAEVERGLPETAVNGDPALMYDGVPIDRRRNKPDFSVLGGHRAGRLRSHRLAARGTVPAGDHRSAAAPGGGDRQPVPNLQAEASPLLMFNANDARYTVDCRFGGDAELWQFQSAHNSLDHESFSAGVTRQQAHYRFPDTPETKMVALDTMIPSVVSVVRHRIGMVTPLINGYDPESVRRMIRDAAHSPLTDTRIQPPLDPTCLWRAGFSILGGLVLGNEVIFTLDDDKFRFTYTIQDAAGFTHPFHVRLPMDFQAAYEWLRGPRWNWTNSTTRSPPRCANSATRPGRGSRKSSRG